VRAQLESQIRAVDLKRSSDAIEDAVSSDALGQYPTRTWPSRCNACRASA
jgi:hypothetical protein